MRELAKAFWNALNDTVKYHSNKDKYLHFDESRRDFFLDESEKLYNTIKDHYMDNSKVTVLDRHKVAAVCIIESIKSNAVQYRGNIDEDHRFLGPQMFATEVAFAWMLGQLNECLKKAGLAIQLKTLYMPEAFVCDTPYFEIFSRNLFFSPDFCNGGYNPLDIAEKLYLLEYITLLKNNVDPTMLHNN